MEQYFNKWARTGNDHLLAYVFGCAARKKYFDPVQTRTLVDFKNAWAEDMHADDKGAGIPIEQQQEAWRDCMARAEIALMPAEVP